MLGDIWSVAAIANCEYVRTVRLMAEVCGEPVSDDEALRMACDGLPPDVQDLTRKLMTGEWKGSGSVEH